MGPSEHAGPLLTPGMSQTAGECMSRRFPFRSLDFVGDIRQYT
jgi:hypothetical protein